MDLCCGIGGDTMSLAAMVSGGAGGAGGVMGIDSDPLRAWMTAKNAGCATTTADVTAMPLRDRVFHLDPSRRDAHGRRHHYHDYLPGPDFIDDLLTRCPTGAVKLGPGVDTHDLPDGEIEFISQNGTLVQAVMWCGELRRDHARTATLLPEDVSLHGEPDEPPIGEAQRYLFTVNPAAERAELLAQLGLHAIHPRLGILTADTAQSSPWLTAFELIQDTPWRPRKVKHWLDAQGAGIVEVKTRGGAVNTDQVQQQLRGDGDQRFTVFVLRFDRQLRALIARRITS